MRCDGKCLQVAIKRNATETPFDAFWEEYQRNKGLSWMAWNSFWIERRNCQSFQWQFVPSVPAPENTSAHASFTLSLSPGQGHAEIEQQHPTSSFLSSLSHLYLVSGPISRRHLRKRFWTMTQEAKQPMISVQSVLVRCTCTCCVSVLFFLKSAHPNQWDHGRIQVLLMLDVSWLFWVHTELYRFGIKMWTCHQIAFVCAKLAAMQVKPILWTLCCSCIRGDRDHPNIRQNLQWRKGWTFERVAGGLNCLSWGSGSSDQLHGSSPGILHWLCRAEDFFNFIAHCQNCVVPKCSKDFFSQKKAHSLIVLCASWNSYPSN